MKIEDALTIFLSLAISVVVGVVYTFRGGKFVDGFQCSSIVQISIVGVITLLYFLWCVVVTIATYHW